MKYKYIEDNLDRCKGIKTCSRIQCDGIECDECRECLVVISNKKIKLFNNDGYMFKVVKPVEIDRDC